MWGLMGKKRSQRRVVHYESDQLGCMWGLINMFDFRRGGSPHKMISDRRRGSRLFSGKPKPRVKKLIEEEMLSDSELNRKINTIVVVDGKHPQSESENGNKKNRKKSNEIENMGSETKLNLDLSHVIDELRAQINKRNITTTENTDFQEMVREATKMFFREKNLISDGKIHNYEEIMDAVELLISNKVFMEKLLEDPKTCVKQVQTLEETKADTNEVIRNPKHHKFFRRKNKSLQKSPSEKNEISRDPKRIVILKPASAVFQSKDIVKHNGSGEKNVSQFSFTEFKRKLKQAMGIERSQASTSLSNRFPHIVGENVARKSPSRDFYIKKFSTSPKRSGEIITESFPKKGVSNIYIEAKKHLSEMLSNEDGQEDLSTKQVPKILGKILSFPEYSISPLYSPQSKFESGHEKTTSINEKINSSPLVQSSETRSSDCDLIDYDKVVSSNLDQEISDKMINEEQVVSTPLTSPPSSPITSKLENMESRPSPVSVLDPVFLDGDISPESTISPPTESSITPLHIRFEENDTSDTDQSSHAKTREEDLKSIFEYCETLLQASGICWDELYIKSLSSNQLLDPTLFEEVMFFSNHLCHDQKLLFDCINGLLLEICDYYFGPSPWVSFVKPNIKPIPNMDNTINEVCEGVEWCLTAKLSPRSLEQIVVKDLAKNGRWVDIRFDTENICAEISEIIFGELIEDMQMMFMERNVGDDFAELEAQLKENDSRIFV